MVAQNTGTASTATRVDFTAVGTSGLLTFDVRLQTGDVTLVRCRTKPNPDGGRIVSPQATIVVPAGAPFELDWQPGDGGPPRSVTIGRGQVMVYAANRPVWKRWTGCPNIVVMALSADFLKRVREGDFEPDAGTGLHTYVGRDDPIADDLMRLAERELDEGGPRGRLYLEGLATALAVHTLQFYGGQRRIAQRTGGLDPAKLRQVTGYMEARLSEDLPLTDLAALAGLSPHHFGEAFKAATGLPPHQYVIRARVQRARDLLHDSALSVAQVAVTVGFASQSHLTKHFRRVTGTTPARFRRR